MKGGDNTSFKISGGDFTYVVRAVDIAGKESANSNAVKVGEDPKPEPPPKEDEPDKPKEPKDPKKPEDPPDDPEKPEPPPPEGDSGDEDKKPNGG